MKLSQAGEDRGRHLAFEQSTIFVDSDQELLQVLK